MNLKKKLRKFFTLSRKAEGGFTLVELIVVIAILAILGGVGVPAYSGYVDKANKTADIALAGEIRQALLLAHYRGQLEDKAYVIVSKDAAPCMDNPNPESPTKAAMEAYFGSGWEDLRLKYGNWEEEVGVAGNAMVMEWVKNSNFTPDGLNSLLGQVQKVVGAASNALVGNKLSDENVAKMLGIKNGTELTEETAQKAANAYVYSVADQFANFGGFGEGENDNENDFYEAWGKFDLTEEIDGLDDTARSAAQYASIYALATYIDKESKGTKNYVEQLNNSQDADPRDTAKKILGQIKDDMSVSNYYDEYINGEGLLAAQDAASFLAYMNGISSSKDTLLGKTDLGSDMYFTDGFVADYVNDYMAMSNSLTSNNVKGGIVLQYFKNDSQNPVRCMPDGMLAEN